MIVGIVYITKTNPTPPTPIINEYYSTVTHQVVEPPKKVIMEEEICTRIDGCRIIENVCVDCLTVKNGIPMENYMEVNVIKSQVKKDI